jgi:hypothetical protein
LYLRRATFVQSRSLRKVGQLIRLQFACSARPSTGEAIPTSYRQNSASYDLGTELETSLLLVRPRQKRLAIFPTTGTKYRSGMLREQVILRIRREGVSFAAAQAAVSQLVAYATKPASSGRSTVIRGLANVPIRLPPQHTTT